MTKLLSNGIIFSRSDMLRKIIIIIVFGLVGLGMVVTPAMATDFIYNPVKGSYFYPFSYTSYSYSYTAFPYSYGSYISLPYSYYSYPYYGSYYSYPYYSSYYSYPYYGSYYSYPYRYPFKWY